ncbi:DUF1398 domain-containing protein [Rurimicrobium arvi]
MFTVAQLKAAHSKVRSGADFPAYIREIGKLGVRWYDTFVIDGNSIYYGEGDHAVPTGARYASISIADNCDAAQFRADLLAHQQGKTDFFTFCSDCARSGVDKWVICMDALTCTYYDKAGNEVLVEMIPQ